MRAFLNPVLLALVVSIAMTPETGFSAKKPKKKKAAPAQTTQPVTKAEPKKEDQSVTASALTPVTLRWEALPGAVVYLIEISTDYAFAQQVSSERVTTPEYAFTPPTQQHFYWRVRGIDANGREGKLSAVKDVTPDTSVPAASPLQPGGKAEIGNQPPPAAPPALEPITAAPLKPEPESTLAVAPASAAAPPATQAEVTTTQAVIQETAPAATGYAPIFPFTASVELGTIFPQAVSKLGTGFNVLIEAGYILPYLDQRFEVFADFSYTQPKRQQTLSDPRLTAGGSYSYEITEQQLFTTLGALARLYSPRTQLNFYGQLGARLNMQRSQVVGDAAAAAFGKNEETKTQVGLLLAAGAEYILGPGAIAAELDFTFATLDHRITGDTNAGGIVLQVGYHFLL